MKVIIFVIKNIIICICDYCKNLSSKNQCLALLKYDVMMLNKLVELIKENKTLKQK